MFMYPKHLLLTVMEDPGMKSRLLQILQHGITHTSDYSGAGAEREVMRLMCQAIVAETGVSVPQVVRRSCDICPTDLQDSGQSCVFPDITKQIHETAQTWLTSCDLGDDADTDQRAVAYKDRARSARQPRERTVPRLRMRLPRQRQRSL